MRFAKADINYFFALLVTGTMLGLWFVTPVIKIALMSIGADLIGDMWGIIFTIAVVSVTIVFVWKRNGVLAPAAIAPGREKRYRVGNFFAGLANAIIFLALLGSILGHYTISDFGLVSAFLIAGAVLVAVPIFIVGIVCIETSRQRK